MSLKVIQGQKFSKRPNKNIFVTEIAISRLLLLGNLNMFIQYEKRKFYNVILFTNMSEKVNLQF